MKRDCLKGGKDGLNTLWHNQWCPQATTNLRRKQQNDDWHRPVNDDAAIAIRALSAEPAHIDFAIAALEAVAATAEREPDKVPGDGATGFTARRRRAAALLARVRDSHDDSLLYAGATLPPLHTANREHT